MGRKNRHPVSQKENQEIRVAKLNVLGVTITALLSLIGVVLTAYFGYLASSNSNSQTVVAIPTAISNVTNLPSSNPPSQLPSNTQNYLLYATGIGCITSIIIIFALGNVLSKKFPRFVFEMASRKTVIGVRREPPKAYLVSNDSWHKNERFGISATTRIGRDNNFSDLIINSEYISGFHCTILETKDGFAIKDEGSINGTTVNKIGIKPNEIKQLQDGDVIQLGGYNGQSFIFETSRV